MATFLFTTLPTDDLGLLTRSLPIARELRALGHLVRFSSPAPAPRRLVADAGFENLLPRHPLYDLLGGDQSLAGLVAYLRSGRWRERHRTLLGLLAELLPALPLRHAPPSDDVWSIDHAGALLGMLHPGFVRAHVQALGEVLAACDPDVVVDFWNPFAVMAARAAGKPLVTVIQADGHPLGSGFVWWKPRPTPPPPSPARAVSRVLAELGLPPVSRIEELGVGDLTLVVGSPATDPLPAEAEVTWVGLALWEEAGARLPASLEALGRERPLVWVYSGTPRYGYAGRSLDSAVVIEACIEALAGEDVDVLLTTGHHRLPPEVPALPPNFGHLPYVPGLAMAARADLLVHHGGYGSCQTGLHAGKPAVILPTYSERESNARRLAALGAAELVEVGRRGGRKWVDAGALRAAVRGALSTPAYAEKARALGESLRALGGPPRAAQLIERFAREHPRRAA